MLARIFSFCLFLTISGHLYGQANRYIVYFKDKIGTPYSILQPEKFLTGASLKRRANQNIAFSEEDLPVNPANLLKVKLLGAKTFFTSRWLNCLLVECSPLVADNLSKLAEVKKVDYVAPGNRLIGGRVSNQPGQNQVTQTTQNQPLLLQYQQVGIDQMNSLGYNGEGISIAIFDGGFLGVNTAGPFQNAKSKIKYIHNFVENSKNVYSFDNHGTKVFSVIAAQSTSFTGGATAADFSLFVTEDVASEYRVEEYNWLFAAERADSLGIDIINSSIGYHDFDDDTMDYKTSDLNGKSAIVSIAASKALTKGMVVVKSAGNEGNKGWKYVVPPGDTDGVLTVGSITIQQDLSYFSSIGPTSDKRIKPDVVALGSSVTVVNSSGNLVVEDGTSFSCPLITCLVAGVWQAYPTLSGQGIYNAIIRSGDQTFNPDNLKGYGLPSFKGVKNYMESVSIDVPFVISPNPVQNIMKVVFKEPKEGDIIVTITDIMGRPISTTTAKMNWQNNPIEFDVSMLEAGVYVVQIKSSAQSLTSRIIKL